MTVSRKHRLPQLFLFLGVMQAAHSIEEVLTRMPLRFPIVTGAVHEAMPVFPVIRMSEPLFAAANIAIVGFLLSLAPFVFLNRTWAQKLAQVIAAVEIVNGIAHLSAALFTGRYYPGCVSAPGLVALGVLIFLNHDSK